jgi:hypothetical protein
MQTRAQIGIKWCGSKFLHVAGGGVKCHLRMGEGDMVFEPEFPFNDESQKMLRLG